MPEILIPFFIRKKKKERGKGKGSGKNVSRYSLPLNQSLKIGGGKKKGEEEEPLNPLESS